MRFVVLSDCSEDVIGSCSMKRSAVNRHKSNLQGQECFRVYLIFNHVLHKLSLLFQSLLSTAVFTPIKTQHRKSVGFFELVCFCFASLSSRPRLSVISVTKMTCFVFPGLAIQFNCTPFIKQRCPDSGSRLKMGQQPVYIGSPVGRIECRTMLMLSYSTLAVLQLPKTCMLG